MRIDPRHAVALRALLTIAITLLLAVFVMHGEVWAIRDAPLLPLGGHAILLADAGCIAYDDADAVALPLPVLY